MIDFSNLTIRIRQRLGAIRSRRLEISRHSRELTDSSDRALADIGLARGDVAAVVRGQFGRA